MATMEVENNASDSLLLPPFIKSLKRTFDLFQANHASLKTSDDFYNGNDYFNLEEYARVRNTAPAHNNTTPTFTNTSSSASSLGVAFISPINLPIQANQYATETGSVSPGLVEYYQAAEISERINPPVSSLSVINPTKYTKPKWHAPWKLMRVISGHTGWVRTISINNDNEWFVTGSSDRTIKVWDLATGTLKVTLHSHSSSVRAVVVSPRHPYMISCGEDNKVVCWDLEINKVIRQYHGHRSAVYCAAIHPTIDVLVTGGRDSTARVWDMRTKQAVHILSGHQNAVCAVSSQTADPQIVTGSHDSTIRLWDLRTGKSMATLTNHKKSVRALITHPSEFTFCSGAADSIKVWKFPDGNFVCNIYEHDTIVNALAINRDNVLVSAADNGTMQFFDWNTGYSFQQLTTPPQPGSLDSEASIFALTFDNTGSHLISCAADKTIKIYKEDTVANEETHPVRNWHPICK